MMHPLCEQAPMQEYLTIVMVRNLIQTCHERDRQIARSVHSVRVYVPDQLSDASWWRTRSSHTTLQLTHQPLALINTAHRMKTCGCQAICLPSKVVRDDDAGVPGISLVQGSQLPQVIDLLNEEKLAFHALAIKIREQDSARVSVLHFSQSALQTFALNVLKHTKSIIDFLDLTNHVLQCEVLHA